MVCSRHAGTANRKDQRMDALWSQLLAIAADPYAQLAQRKEATGQKVIGCFPMYVPEELIHAAGMLPAVIFGGHEAISEADSRLQPYVCSVVRSGLDRAPRGELGVMGRGGFPV